MAEPLLRAEGLRAEGLASQPLSLRLEAGSLTALIGPADADKDALVALVAGRQRMERGTLLFGGRPIGRLGAAARVREGLVTSLRAHALPAAVEPVAGVAVALAAAGGALGPWWRRAWSAGHRSAAEEILTFVGLGAGQPDGAPLGPLDRARLELALLLALRPRLMVVDRLSRGLAAAERAMVAALLVRIVAGGITILWVEDDIDLVGGVATAAIVLTEGRVVAAGPIDALVDAAVAQAAFLGDPR